MSKRINKNNRSNTEDKLLLFLDKSKIKTTLFQFLMGNFDLIREFILRNGDVINIENTTGKLMYITTNIKKYEDLIVSYKIEGKSTELFSIERENLMETEEILYNELIDYIIKYLLKAKEIIFYNNDMTVIDNYIHILISDKEVHSITHPAVYSENYSIMRYYINGGKIDEMEWKRHPLVRTNTLKNILLKIRK